MAVIIVLPDVPIVGEGRAHLSHDRADV